MFILYETTCLINDKKYIGVHEQECEDGYLGSGKHFKRAVRKYGRDKFIRRTLETFITRAEAYHRESEVVGDEIVSSSQYYNMVPGGKGGNIWTDREATIEKMKQSWWNRTPEYLHRLRTQNIGRKLSPEHRQAINDGKNNSATKYQIDDLGVFTLKDFCDKMGYNLSSCRVRVWKAGKYKGHTITSL